MMDLKFDLGLAEGYKSASQRSRVLTEGWVHKEIFCPSCGVAIVRFPHNNPAADFYCPSCGEVFELKSKQGAVGKKIVDGAYMTLMSRLAGRDNPNLFILTYDIHSAMVHDFLVIPKHFFIASMIEKRPPLSATSRRAGWVGCNIVITDVPATGKIHYVRDTHVQPKESVLDTWKKTAFLNETSNSERGWIIDVINCVDRIPSNEFTLSDVYRFEPELSEKHPENIHVKAKIRQQLQMMRDKKYIVFLGKGQYRKT